MKNNMTPSNAVDIFELAKPELEQQKLRREIIGRLKALRQSGMSKEDVAGIIKEMNLPLGLHLHLMGRFSELIG